MFLLENVALPKFFGPVRRRIRSAVRSGARLIGPANKQRLLSFMSPGSKFTAPDTESGRVVRRLDFGATVTSKLVFHQPETPAVGRIAAICPIDFLEDLKREPVAITTWPPADDTRVLLELKCDFLLLVPDGHLYENGWKSEFFAPERGGRLMSILDAANASGVPIVVWFTTNLVHSPHFDWLKQRAGILCATADSELKEGESVLDFPVCFQPRLFNPFIAYEDNAVVESSSSEIFLDGWWTSADTLQHNQNVLSLKPRLAVVDSAWEHSALRESDNVQYRANSLGCISPVERALVGKFWNSELFVEDHTLPLSMLQKRAKEAIGTDCYPVSFSSRLHDSLVGNALPLRHPASISAEPNDNDLVEYIKARMDLHVARRKILSDSTYGICLEKIRKKLDLPAAASEPPLVSVVLVSRRPHLIQECIEKVAAQTYPRIEFIYVLHGAHENAAETLEKAKAGGAISLQLDRTFSLGACINVAARFATGEYLAKFDDDDFYGPNYLSDLMSYRNFVDFDVIGKPPGFYYRSADGKLYFDRGSMRREWRFAAPESERILSAGAAMMAKRNVFKHIPYPETRRGGADSEFLRQCQRAGIVTYSADVFNFVVYRDPDDAFHTWKIGEEHMASLVDLSPALSLADVMI